MTQQNILRVLKKKDKWMTSKEIAKFLKISSGNVNVSLNKLFKQEDVLRKTLKINIGIFNDNSSRPYYWRAK